MIVEPKFPAAHRTHAEAVVLLHSSASSARQWDWLADALRPHFDVCAVELHGHGEQAARPVTAPLTLAEEAALALRLLARTGGAHVVGHSFGAAIALKLAAMRPDLVRSVVAYEPVLFRWLADDAAGQQGLAEIVAVAEAVRECVVRGDTDEAARRFVDFWSGAGAWQALPAARQQAIASRMGAVSQHFDALFRERMKPAHLARLDMPMLFLSGTETVPAARRLADLARVALPHARHEALPGMGHMGPMTHAAQVNARIVSFLAEQRQLAARWERESLAA